MAQQPPEIPLADVQIAQHIADAARGGRPVDRTPTLEQLLAAFGEPQPTPQARARVVAALAVAGVQVSPDLMTVPPGSRVSLDVGKRPRAVGRGLAGLLALGLLIAVAAVAAVLLRGDDNGRVADLPATTTTTPATTTPTTTTGTTPVATVTTPAATQTTTIGTTTAATTTTTTTTKPSAAKPKSKKKTKRRTTPRTVRIRLIASRPTYLCVKDATGRQLFGGTLSGARVFEAKVLRINVGLGDTTTLIVNGKRLPLYGSPAGYELRPGGKAVVLGTGQRPEC